MPATLRAHVGDTNRRLWHLDALLWMRTVTGLTDRNPVTWATLAFPPMDEAGARFDLLKAEISELQQSIRAFDSARFQIKGWAISLALASAGVAFTSGAPILNLLGAAAVFLMLLVEAHQRTFQMALIARARRIELALNTTTVSQFVMSRDPDMPIPGHATASRGLGRSRDHLRYVLNLALLPGTFILYLGLIAGLLVLAAVAVG